MRTILDMIQIDNSIVLQQMVIINNIEKIVIVDSHHDGDNILRNGVLPEKVLRMFTRDCFEVGSRAGLSASSMNMYLGPSRLVEDIEQLTRYKLTNLKGI